MHSKLPLLRITFIFALLVPSIWVALAQIGFELPSLVNHQKGGATITVSNLFDTSRNGQLTLIGFTHLGQGANFAVLDVQTGKRIQLRSPDDVLVLREGVGSISPTGKLAAAGFITNQYGAKVAWWRVQEVPEQINELSLRQVPHCIKWRSDDELYVCTNILEVFTIREGDVVRRKRLLPKYAEFINLAFSPRSNAFAVVIDDDPKGKSEIGGKPRYSVLLCTVEKDEERVTSIYETNVKIRHLEFSDDGKSLLVGANSDESLLVKSKGNGEIIISRFSDNGGVEKTVLSSPKLWSVALHPNGELMAVGDIFGEVRLMDINTQKAIHTLAANRGPIMHLGFLEQGRSLISGSSEGQVRLWDSKTGKMQREFNVMKDLSK